MQYLILEKIIILNEFLLEIVLGTRIKYFSAQSDVSKVTFGVY